MEPLAEHVRSNPLITGLTIGKTPHNISLFADDVILILTDPTRSLAEVQKTLDWLGKVSYYRLNTTKSHILDLKLNATTKNLLQVQYPFAWPDKTISYLRVHLTRSVKHLFWANFKPFLTKLRIETQTITNQELSWSGRLAAFKMLHLPQILYLFSTLPFLIPRYFFKSLQNLLNRLFGKGPNLEAHMQHS